MSKRASTGLIVLGVLVLLAGVVLWSIETTYGADLNFSVVNEGNVWVVSEESAGEVAQFASSEEADAYIEERQAEGTNYLIPGLVIAVGAALIVGGFISFLRARGEPPVP